MFGYAACSSHAGVSGTVPHSSAAVRTKAVTTCVWNQPMPKACLSMSGDWLLSRGFGGFARYPADASSGRGGGGMGHALSRKVPRAAWRPKLRLQLSFSRNWSYGWKRVEEREKVPIFAKIGIFWDMGSIPRCCNRACCTKMFQTVSSGLRQVTPEAPAGLSASRR
jgi:hypothetical protein